MKEKLKHYKKFDRLYKLREYQLYLKRDMSRYKYTEKERENKIIHIHYIIFRYLDYENRYNNMFKGLSKINFIKKWREY